MCSAILLSKGFNCDATKSGYDCFSQYQYQYERHLKVQTETQERNYNSTHRDSVEATKVLRVEHTETSKSVFPIWSLPQTLVQSHNTCLFEGKKFLLLDCLEAPSNYVFDDQI